MKVFSRLEIRANEGRVDEADLKLAGLMTDAINTSETP